MQEFDKYMEKYCFCRFSDNINVYCDSVEAAQQCIAEIFKPIIVDRAIFTLIHKRELSKNEHFETNEDGAVLLNKIRKKIFIKELEMKLYQKVKIDGVSRTYDAIIRNEIQKIVHTVRNDEKYKPYKYT